MSISNQIKELDGVNAEIKLLNDRIISLKKIKKNLEKEILDFIENSEKRGIQYKDKTLLLDKTISRSKKKNQEKTKDLESILNKHNIPVSTSLVQDILIAQKGQEKEVKKLKIIQKK